MPSGILHRIAAFFIFVLLTGIHAPGRQAIRVAAKRAEIPNESVAVHFFSRDVESGESSITSPVLHANGRFSDWPEGFFDEWSKALDELLDT